MRSGVRIAVVVESRYLSQAQPRGMMEASSRTGHEVVLVDPEASAYSMGEPSWLDGVQVVVARGRSWPLLCLLSWAERRGVPTINRRAAIGAVHNKAEMQVALASARVPTPRSYLGPLRRLAEQVPRASYPLVLKPLFGDNGNGLTLVRSAEDLARLHWTEPVGLAQQFLAGDGYDLKLYGIGADVWAVRKPCLELGADGPSRTRVPDPEPVLARLTPALRELGRRCATLFGLEFYGVDCIETSAGVLVIEVNDFPNYSGVPDAGERLVAHVVRRS